MKKYIVITTINPKSEGIIKFESLSDWKIVLVGDKKSNHINSTKNLIFLSIEDQKNLGYHLVNVCPFNHYTRKNIGYLYAIQNGADIIYDTDDDNIPNDDWSVQNFSCSNKYRSSQKFVNIYKYFTKEKIWPRGYPLDYIQNPDSFSVDNSAPMGIAVWQGLANIDPDVDAIYRLTINKEIHFEDKPSVALEKGVYCPFNSQNTVWNRKAFPYLYLPATTSFRFTDILRGYIAQRLFWEQDLHLGFTNATVYQDRNAHDLMRDFSQEIECYLNVKPIVKILDNIKFDSDPLSNLYHVYRSLLDHKYIDAEELKIVTAWGKDLVKLLT